MCRGKLTPYDDSAIFAIFAIFGKRINGNAIKSENLTILGREVFQIFLEKVVDRNMIKTTYKGG